MSTVTYEVVGDPVGPTVTGGDIEDAALELLKDWLPRYLAAVEDQHGEERGKTPTPRGWGVTGQDWQKLIPDQLPCIILLAGGLRNPPEKEGGQGVLRATWGLGLIAFLSTAWGRESRRRCQWYARAIHLTLEQRPFSALGQPCAVRLRDEKYDQVDFPDSRTYAAALCAFDVHCREVAWANGGPPPGVQPPADPTEPFSPWVQVTDTEVDVINNPPDGSVEND